MSSGLTRSVMLAPNQAISAEDLTYPRIASFKLDGVRGLFYGNQIVSRSCKPLSPAIHRVLEDFRKKVGDTWVFDGEIYAHGFKFNEIMSMIKHSALVVRPELQYHVFDMNPKHQWDNGWSIGYEDRLEIMRALFKDISHPRVKLIETRVLNSAEEAVEYYDLAIELGYEGLILRRPNSRYKHGRATMKEDSIHKLKPWETVDLRIVGFNQAEEMSKEYEEGPRTRDVLGHLERTSKQATRVKVEGIGSVSLQSLDGKMEVSGGFAKGSDLRSLITWANRETFIGKVVECRYMDHGIKDRLRFVGIMRLRPDLDE